MKKIDRADFKIIQDDNFITLSILKTIDKDTLKERLGYFLEQKYINLLDYLISEDGKYVGENTIIIHLNNNIIEQFVKNKLSYFYLGDKELLIDRGERTYFYFENNRLYTTKGMNTSEKEQIIPKICDILNYLKDIHDNKKYGEIINYLYYEIGIVNQSRVSLVMEDDSLELVIPDFYQISPIWMKMAIVLKQTKEIIGSIEFNYKEDSDNFYDYKGNVSYEIKDEYQGCGYATAALSLVRKYLQSLNINDCLYISTEVLNVASQKVALKNEGILCYDGNIPKSSIVSFLGKVDKVKIYRISNM